MALAAWSFFRLELKLFDLAENLFALWSEEHPPQALDPQ
jgi:hypothetical protein